MWIIGCDFHSGFQQLAIFDNLNIHLQAESSLATRFWGSSRRRRS
jgi:hypothetical protein